MSDSVAAIGSTSPLPALEPLAGVHSDPVVSPTTSSYADATAEVPKGDGSVVVIVTDAQGEVISATTIQPHADPVVTAEPAHVLSIEA